MVSSYAKTALLLAGLTALFMAGGYLLGGQGGMMIAFVVALAMNAWSYWNSDKMLLSMHNAELVQPADHPELYAMVQRLAMRAEIPMPKLYLIHEAQPNAFATGRNPENAAVAINTGLLDLMMPDEVEGVVAHELAHIKNRDILIMTVTATLAGALSMLAQFGMFFSSSRDQQQQGGFITQLLVVILAPLAAMLVQMAISRSREYEADRIGAMIAGQPEGLAKALQRLSEAVPQIPNPVAEAHPATAHLFIYNPLTGQGMDNLFSTHPHAQNRIAALMALRERGAFRDMHPPASGAREKGPWG